jgi:hypothetical protein
VFSAGQANSNFRDADAEPETLDFGGPPGQAGVVRIPQVRYTYNGPWGSAWAVALEAPDTDLIWNDSRYVDRSLLGYGGGVSGNLMPGWFGWAKDDITWEINAGNRLGHYLTDSTNAGLATNYIVAPGCATPTPGCALAATSPS